MRNLSPDNNDILNAVYETRLLLFMECSPQSNRYRQIMLTPEKFRKVSDCLASLLEGDDKRGYSIPVDDTREITLAEEIRSSYGNLNLSQ